MPRKAKPQTPVWRACTPCRSLKRKCVHKHAMLLPLKTDGPDAGLKMLVGFPGRAPEYGRKRKTVAGTSQGPKKRKKGCVVKPADEEETDAEEVVVYGTISVATHIPSSPRRRSSSGSSGITPQPEELHDTDAEGYSDYTPREPGSSPPAQRSPSYRVCTREHSPSEMERLDEELLLLGEPASPLLEPSLPPCAPAPPTETRSPSLSPPVMLTGSLRTRRSCVVPPRKWLESSGVERWRDAGQGGSRFSGPVRETPLQTVGRGRRGEGAREEGRRGARRRVMSPQL